jgi:transposase
MTRPGRRKRRVFTKEFKAEAVAVLQSSGKSLQQVAKDLELTESALRRWERQAEGGSAAAVPAAETERGELLRLREEVRVLRMERDFLKKAAAFFAKEHP